MYNCFYLFVFSSPANADHKACEKEYSAHANEQSFSSEQAKEIERQRQRIYCFERLKPSIECEIVLFLKYVFALTREERDRKVRTANC